jgi:hypothetical protein
MTHRTAEGVSHEIAEKFGRIRHVRSVYLLRYRKELRFLVTLAISRYDSLLMDALLDLEYEIQGAHPDLLLDFSYPPVGGLAAAEIVIRGARCIFSK